MIYLATSPRQVIGPYHADELMAIQRGINFLRATSPEGTSVYRTEAKTDREAREKFNKAIKE